MVGFLVYFGRKRPAYFAGLLVAGAILATAGCSRIPGMDKLRGLWKSDTQAGAETSIAFSLGFWKAAEGKPTVADSLTAPPGAPVYIRAQVRNQTDKTVRVQLPDVASVEFFVKPAQQESPVLERPVFSPKDKVGSQIDLAPGQMQRRTFIFTTLTEQPGDYQILAQYHITPKGMPSDYPPAISTPILLRVAGQRVCRRDADGILLKEDAVELAKRHLGRPVSDVKALLHEDEAGFLVWWITLKIDSSDLKRGEEPYRAFFVCPYLATVIKNRKARPYIPQPKEEGPELPPQLEPVPSPPQP